MRASRQVYQILKMLRECKTILSRHLAANVLQLLKKRLPTLSMQQICQHKAIHAAGNCRRALSCDPYMAQMPTPIHPSVPALEFLFFTSENRVVSGRMLANVSPTLWQISIARYTWTKVLPHFSKANCSHRDCPRAPQRCRALSLVLGLVLAGDHLAGQVSSGTQDAGSSS